MHTVVTTYCNLILGPVSKAGKESPVWKHASRSRGSSMGREIDNPLQEHTRRETSFLPIVDATLSSYTNLKSLNVRCLSYDEFYSFEPILSGVNPSKPPALQV